MLKFFHRCFLPLLLVTVLPLLGCNLLSLALEDSPTVDPKPEATQISITATTAEQDATSLVQSSTATPAPPLVELVQDYEISDGKPTPFPAVHTDTSQQTAVLEEYWAYLETDHVYRLALADLFAELRPESEARLAAGMSNAEFWAMLSEMTYALGDEHSYFFTADQSEGVRNLSRGASGYSGVGVALVGLPETQTALVGWAIPDNPASQVGIRAGDQILAVDGFRYCCAGNGEPFNFLSGPGDVPVEILVQKPNGDVLEVTVNRAPIQLTSEIEVARFGDIGYLRINTFFSHDIRAKFETEWQALNAKQDLAGLIIDLRTNTGGLINPMHNILANFVDGDLHWYYEPYAEDGKLIPRNMRGDDVLGSQSIPLAVLVSAATNSGGELFAGYLSVNQGHRTTIIGMPTHANIEKITPYELSDGSTLYLATDTIWPLEGNWEEDGVPLDIQMEFDWQHLGDPDLDAVLNKALEVLN